MIFHYARGMRRGQEETKTTAQHALERALKGAVWVRNKDGDYTTILPNRSPYLTKLTALAVTLKLPGDVLKEYDWLDNASARKITVNQQFVRENNYSPILLKFEEDTLPSHKRSMTQAMLYMLNAEWAEEKSIPSPETPLHTTSLHVGEMARAVYAYLRLALEQSPDNPALIKWNQALVLNHEASKDQIHLHLSPPLEAALFGEDFTKLMKWRRSLDPFLGKKYADQPAVIHIATEFAQLREAIQNFVPPEKVPTVRVSRPKEEGRAKTPDDPNQGRLFS